MHGAVIAAVVVCASAVTEGIREEVHHSPHDRGKLDKRELDVAHHKIDGIENQLHQMERMETRMMGVGSHFGGGGRRAGFSSFHQAHTNIEQTRGSNGENLERGATQNLLDKLLGNNDLQHIAFNQEEEDTSNVLKGMFHGRDPRHSHRKSMQAKVYVEPETDDQEVQNKYGDKLSFAEKMLPKELQKTMLKDKEKEHEEKEKLEAETPNFLDNSVLAGLGFNMKTPRSFSTKQNDAPKFNGMTLELPTDKPQASLAEKANRAASHFYQQAGGHVANIAPGDLSNVRGLFELPPPPVWNPVQGFTGATPRFGAPPDLEA